MKVLLGQEEQPVAQRIGLALRSARIKAGQTQDELAARIGVTRWTIASMESGDPKVSLAAWIKASNLLGLLKTWEEVMVEPEDPFEAYDKAQEETRRLANTRVRKRNAPAND